eukprot:Rmarinus@m.13795
MSQLEIRDASIADISSVEVLREANRKLFNLPARIEAGGDFAQDLQVKWYKLLIAAEGDKPIGYLLYTYSYSTWDGKAIQVQEMYVSPENRRKSAGQRLLRRVAELESDAQRIQWFGLASDTDITKFGEYVGANRLVGWTNFWLESEAMTAFLGQPHKQPGDLTITPATPSDMNAVLDMIVKLAVYERAPEAVHIDASVLKRDGFEKARPLFQVLIARMGAEIVGYAFYFYGYHTCGRLLFLEDLYVAENQRGKRIGFSLLRAITEEAKKNNCARVQWQALDWNTPAIDFYTKIVGAREVPEWIPFRFDRQDIVKHLLP